MPVPSAPDDLRAIEDFCNSVEFLRGVDHLAHQAAGDAWLNRHGYAVGIDDGGLRDLRAAREQIRALLAGEDDGRAKVNRLLADHLSPPVLDAAGTVRFTACAPDIPELVLVEVLACLIDAHTSGRNGRLKVCRAPDCQWVFYDRSRPRTRVWCDMEVCGSRHKMATYRARRLPA